MLQEFGRICLADKKSVIYAFALGIFLCFFSDERDHSRGRWEVVLGGRGVARRGGIVGGDARSSSGGEASRGEGRRPINRAGYRRRGVRGDRGGMTYLVTQGIDFVTALRARGYGLLRGGGHGMLRGLE
jgi:hypothetical protein